MALNLRQYRDGIVRRRHLQLYWWNGRYHGVSGVYYVQSNAESEERSPVRGMNQVACMSLNFNYLSDSSSIIGRDFSECLGRVGELVPAAEGYGVNVRAFCEHMAPFGEPLYHAIVCHSKAPSDDGIHCAIDFCWQGPRMIGDTYNWYTLQDITEPEEWLLARRVNLCGQRTVTSWLD